MSLCRICLRTDKNVMVINPTLSKFHDELSNFHAFDIIDSEFCSECEYLLKKMYNFKQKCKRAAKIFHKWINGQFPSETMCDLYKFMPTSSIGRWTSTDSKVIIFVEGVTPEFDNVTDGNIKQRSSKTYSKPHHTVNANSKEVTNLKENTTKEGLSVVKMPRKVYDINAGSHRKILKRPHADVEVNAPSNQSKKPTTLHNDNTVIKEEYSLELPFNDEVDDVPSPQPIKIRPVLTHNLPAQSDLRTPQNDGLLNEKTINILSKYKITNIDLSEIKTAVPLKEARKEVPYATKLKDHQEQQPQGAKLKLSSDASSNKAMLIKSPCTVYVKNTESNKIKLKALDQDVTEEDPLELPIKAEIDNVPSPRTNITTCDFIQNPTVQSKSEVTVLMKLVCKDSFDVPNKAMLVKPPLKVYEKKTKSKKINLNVLDQNVPAQSTISFTPHNDNEFESIMIKTEDPLEMPLINDEVDNLPCPQPIITQPDVTLNLPVQSKSELSMPTKPVCKDSFDVPNKAMLLKQPFKINKKKTESKKIKLNILDQDVPAESTISHSPHNDNDCEGVKEVYPLELPLINDKIDNVPSPQPIIKKPDVTDNRPVQIDSPTSQNDKSINKKLLKILRKYKITKIDFNKLKVAIPLKKGREVNSAARKQVVSTQSKKKPRKRVRKRVAKDKVMVKSKQEVMAEWYNLEVFRRRGPMNRKSGFSGERLKAMVTQHLESCGQLKTDDGIVIDKQFIIDSLDEKVPELVMRKLWRAYNYPRVSKKALQLYRWIQVTYKQDYESVFNIEYLNTVEKVLDEFQNRKNYECYLNAEFKCEICYQGFKYEKRLKYHQNWHDVTSRDFACTVCNLRFTNKLILARHLLHSHEAVYKCMLCPLITYTRNSMINHYKWHKGVIYWCEPCNLTYRSKSAYWAHASYKHSRAHVCNRCACAFNTASGLSTHITRIHKNEPLPAENEFQVKCLLCELLFPSNDVMEKHISITHTGEQGEKSELQLRKRKKANFTCRVCNAVGFSGGWLSLHFRKEHPSTDMEILYADTKGHLCHICGKGFSTLAILRTHLNKHNGVRPYLCDLCPKRFYSSLLRKHHRQTHLPPGRSCQYCGKKFRSEANLLNHKRVHIGDRRYECKCCGKGFLHANALKVHIRGVHHNIRRVRKKEGAKTKKD